MKVCKLCAGTGKLTLLHGMLTDTRLRESFRRERCPRCDGSGETARNRKADSWTREQTRLRELCRQAK